VELLSRIAEKGRHFKFVTVRARVSGLKCVRLADTDKPEVTVERRQSNQLAEHVAAVNG
jgi:hypothetical protein